MFKRQLTIPGLAILAILATLPAARGTTVDTFSFTEGDWSNFSMMSNGTVTLNPIPTGILTGSFTGVVEPGGFIELADLSAFTLAYQSQSLTTGENLASLTLFSYDTNGGASSLDIAGLGFPFDLCVGAAATLQAGCTANFQENFPAGTKGVVDFDGIFEVSPDQPVITLVSSVTTNPTVTPEPQSTVFVILALIALVLAHSRSKSNRTL